MRFDPERCAHCGGPPRTFQSQYGLSPEGRMSPDEKFFFCSDECLAKEINRHLPTEVAIGKTIGDDAEYRRLLKERDAYFERCWPRHVLYSNEELAEKAKDEAEEQAIITRYEDDWLRTRDQGIKSAIDAISQTWKAQEAFVRRQRDEERRLAEEAQRAFEQSILPRPIPDHILGPSGSGKTTLIQELVLADLGKPDPPAIVIIDPKGLLVDRISKLALFADRLKDRLVIVDPTREPLPALNMFEPPPKGTDNQVISNFAYIFSQANAALTAKMRPPFMFAVRLMFTIPGANIFTLMDLFDDDPKQRAFQKHIDRLPDEASRRFFANDFYSSTYGETRGQIKSRLYEIIARPELTEMFNAPVRRLDMFECLQRKKIVLVNTGMLKLGPTGSQLLGRFIISSTLNAAYRRSLIPRSQWNAAYLYIDEFQDFADQEKTPELLRLAREYNLGVILAHQNMHCLELNDSLRTTISTNTSIKYCSSAEAIDQAYMARDLRCDTDFLKNYTTTGTFATFARGMTLQHPFLTTVQFGNIDQQPQMSQSLHQAILSDARNALAVPPQAPKGAHSPSEPNVALGPAASNTERPNELNPQSEAHSTSPAADPHAGDHTRPATEW
jgi:hypothetical protein